MNQSKSIWEDWSFWRDIFRREDQNTSDFEIGNRVRVSASSLAANGHVGEIRTKEKISHTMTIYGVQFDDTPYLVSFRGNELVKANP